MEISVEIPLDGDGFLRRECPSCGRQFKWLSGSDDGSDGLSVSQYFCPLCGVAADVDSWWTPAQLEYAQASAGPMIDRVVLDGLNDAFKGVRGVSFSANPDFTLGIEPAHPLHEPDDMLIVEPLCHPEEPVKIPEDWTTGIHCLICGSMYAA